METNSENNNQNMLEEILIKQELIKILEKRINNPFLKFFRSRYTAILLKEQLVYHKLEVNTKIRYLKVLTKEQEIIK